MITSVTQFKLDLSALHRGFLEAEGPRVGYLLAMPEDPRFHIVWEDAVEIRKATFLRHRGLGIGSAPARIPSAHLRELFSPAGFPFAPVEFS